MSQPFFFDQGEFPLVSIAEPTLHCRVRNKGLSNEEFLSRVKEYLSDETGICETDASGKCLHSISLADLQENTFYLFDSDAVLAFSHTVEDFALDDANGSLLTAMQNAVQFEPHRERYGQLSATLHDVEIIASDKLPRKNRHLKFCHDSKRLVEKFWITLYEGAKCQAMFLGEQINEAENFDDKKFTGFYTFNSRIILATRQDLAESLGGRCPELRQFAQLRSLDRAAKQIKIEFVREKNAMDAAVRKLQNQDGKYHGKHFMADLNKTLERLNRLQTHLPEFIVEPQKK